MRRTKIICTLGPKTEHEEVLKELVREGMNIARINMSHGDSSWHSLIMDRVKRVSRLLNSPIGLMLDTMGPEIRTSGKREMGLKEGELFNIYVGSQTDISEAEKYTFINYRKFIKKVKKNSIILIDNGIIALRVLRVEPYRVVCKVLNSGMLGTKKSVSIPGIKSDLPAITRKDIEDIRLGVKHGIDYVAQSFVRRKSDVRQMRNLLHKLGSRAIIVAKIEDREGLENVDEILEEADGIMVARGDLGVQIPFEEIPIVQKHLVHKCISAGKPVIVATQLLESMIENPRPTRAEVTDVANAVFEKADCIMLSGETTKGKYPVECVQVMDKIAGNTQLRLKFEMPEEGIKTKDVKEAITLAACINAENLDAKAIIVFSKTGRLLSLVTKRRANVDIFVFSDNDAVRRKLTIYWSTIPFMIKFTSNFESMVKNAIKTLKSSRLIARKDRIVIVSDVKTKNKAYILEIREIE